MVDDIYSYIDSTLSTAIDGYFSATVDKKPIEIPIYCGMPDFADGEPEYYIVYTLYDSPTLYADNSENAVEYTVTLNVFMPIISTEILEEIKSTMKSAGFVYQGGGEVGTDTDYPNRRQYYQDFKILF